MAPGEGAEVHPLLRGVAVSPPLIVDESHMAELAAANKTGLDSL